MKTLHEAYGKEKCMKSHDMSFFRKSVSEHSDLAQFALYQNLKTCAALEQIFSDFYEGMVKFTSSANHEIILTVFEQFKKSSGKNHQSNSGVKKNVRIK